MTKMDGPSLNRRALLGSGATIGVMGFGASMAGAQISDQPAPKKTAAEPDGLDDFMKVSTLVTERQNLDRNIGARLFGAFSGSSASTINGLPELVKALEGKNLAPDQIKKAVAIQQAWYLGAVGRTVVMYEQALTFEAVSDYLRPRSYVGGAPGFWSSNPNKPQDNVGSAKYLDQPPAQ